MSDETQKIVDEEIHQLVDKGYETATKLIKKYEKELHAIANGLLEYETLTGPEINDLLKGKPPIRDDDDGVLEPAAAVSAVPTAGKAKKRTRKEGR